MDWNKEFTTKEIRYLKTRLFFKKRNAKARGIEFNLTEDDWFMMGKGLLGKGVCDYTGLPFSATPNDPLYPSVERIDDKKGYVRGNVCVVGKRANQLKDFLVDKKKALTIVDPLDMDIVQGMMLNMSKDHLEKLKLKHIPTETDMKETENVIINEQVEEMKEKSLPDDVEIALAYANYCKTFAEAGMNVSVTYAQFKAKYSRNTCSLTGEKLTKTPKPILIMDLDLGFAKDNFIIVSEKMETALTQLMINTKMSLPKITAMLNKVV